MADIKHITLPNGDTHDIKDATIRDEVKYKIYKSVTDIGLTSGSATIAGAFAAMPSYSVLIAPRSEFAAAEQPVNASGDIEIRKVGENGNLGGIWFHGREDTTGDYRMFLNSSGVPTGTWEKTEGYEVLFDATAGGGANTGTLSHPVSNYYKIKIFFGNSDGGYQGFTEFIPSKETGTSINIPMAYYAPTPNASAQYHVKRMVINGVSFSTDRPVAITLSNGSVTTNTSPNLFIYRVEGYK